MYALQAPSRGNVSLPMELFEPILFQSATQMKTSVGVGRNKPEKEAIDLALDPNIDPDILAALDDAEQMDSGGDLLDDFVVQAQTAGEENDDFDDLALKDVAYTDCFGNEFIPDWKKKDADAVADTPYEVTPYDHQYAESLSDDDYEDDSDEDERRTVRTGFTGLSMTSSRRERGEQGRNLDEAFDQFMEGYDDDAVGELEEEDAMIGAEIEGNTALEAAMDEFVEDHRYLVPLQEAANTATLKVDSQTMAQMENDNLKPNQDPDTYVYEKEEPEWDCETVVSTYSNLENHPKLLDDDLRRIKLSKKTGIALGILPEKQSKKQLAALLEDEEDDEEDDYRPNLGKARSKKETPAEKKARKQALKDEKRARREEKKGLRSEFAREEHKQKNIKANNPRFGVSVKHLD